VFGLPLLPLWILFRAAVLPSVLVFQKSVSPVLFFVDGSHPKLVFSCALSLVTWQARILAQQRPPLCVDIGSRSDFPLPPDFCACPMVFVFVWRARCSVWSRKCVQPFPARCPVPRGVDSAGTRPCFRSFSRSGRFWSVDSPPLIQFRTGGLALPRFELLSDFSLAGYSASILSRAGFSCRNWFARSSSSSTGGQTVFSALSAGISSEGKALPPFCFS
jgi:hypothetical protein